MKIRVEFTVEVDVSDPADRAALLEVAAADDLAAARRFVVAEAESMIRFYLTENGVAVVGDVA